MKRFISALLALCMVCSLMPATGAAEGEATGTEKSGITVVYDYAAQIRNEGYSTVYLDNFDMNTFTFNSSHGLWDYAAGNVNSNCMFRNGCIVQFNKADFWIAIEVYVPKSGLYTLEQKYNTYSTYGTLDVYIIPKGNNTTYNSSLISGVSPTLSQSCKGVDSNFTPLADPAVVENVYFDKGYHYVVYKSSGGGAMFGNLTLNGGADVGVITDMSVIADKTELEVGESGAITTTAYYSNKPNTAATPDAGDVTYKSNNTSVLNVNSDGTYTAVAGGEATITISAGDVTKTVSVSVKGKDMLPASGITVVYDWGTQMKPETGDKGFLKDPNNNSDESFFKTFDFDRSHNLWEYEGNKAWGGYQWRTGDLIQFSRGKGGLRLVFEVKVPKTGTYTLKQVYAKYANSQSTLSIYMIPKGESDAYTENMKTAENKVFALECGGSTTGKVAPAEKKVELYQGNYYVVYQQSSTETEVTNVAQFGNLTLNGGTDEVDVSDTADYDVPTVDGLDITGNLTAKEYNEETNTFTLTAEPEKNGYKFLYWAKGMSNNKKIVSFENKLENYMPEENGRNYLIAVYEGDVPEKAEYYNANGQRVATETEPTDYPSMAGYGKAYDWEQYGDTKIYVAKYALDEPEKNISISVAGGTGSGTYAFGDTVTCTATLEEGKTFKCWTKTLDDDKTEVVSVDETYTFNAWESCTVTAVYEYTYSGSGMKIVIDSFSVTSGVTGIMAEFIGFDSNVVEKGIMFVDEANNETKITMTTPGKQFTVIADEAGTYKGYAVLKNGNAFTLITDGAYTKE